MLSAAKHLSTLMSHRFFAPLRMTKRCSLAFPRLNIPDSNVAMRSASMVGILLNSAKAVNRLGLTAQWTGADGVAQVRAVLPEGVLAAWREVGPVLSMPDFRFTSVPQALL